MVKYINKANIKKMISRLKRGMAVFRNDDVSVDTDINRFREFCGVFHKNGYKQLHGITLYGYLNCRYTDIDGMPLMYEHEKNIGELSYDKIKQLSEGKFIGDNKELIEYLNTIPDDIALHGLYHTDYSKMSYQEQDRDIDDGLKLLSQLFPNKKIAFFIAPFNKTNADTYRVCKKYKLKVSAVEGEHLEDLIAHGRYGIKKGELYRYHHHRFYPETAFSYYKLDMEKLDCFLRFKKRQLPSLDVIKDAVDNYGAQKWYIYAYEKIKERKHCYLVYNWIKKNISIDAAIMESGCGIGGVLYHLFNDGYKNLSGYDLDEKSIAAGKAIASKICAPIDFMTADGFDPKLAVPMGSKYTVILGINWIYHVPGYSLELFIEKHLTYLAKSGYFIFDMIDSGYNAVPNNQFCTQDLNKPEHERRPSEYVLRYSEEEVLVVAEKFELTHIKTIAVDNGDVIPRKIYILQKKLYRICLLCDRPDWAHDHSAQEIARYITNEFDMEINYVIQMPVLNKKRFDLIHVFFWGETYHIRFNMPRYMVIKTLSSHRWQDQSQYGPLSPKEVAGTYLTDAGFVFCPSKILYDLFVSTRKNVFLAGKGYSHNKFYYKNERMGAISICWAGNIKDEVKGVEDILIPACADEFSLNLASDIKHEELLDFYNANDIYVVSSRHEGDPLPLLESMACGCFPICCNVGIVAEVVKHKENGYIVKERTPEAFREAFIWARDNLDFVRTAGKQNAEYMYKTRRWEIMAERYRELYRKILTERSI